MLSPLQGFPVEFETLAQQAPVSIMFIDCRGVICFVNDWHLKYFARGLHEREFFLGRSLFTLPGIVSSHAEEALQSVFSGKDVLLEKVFTNEFSGGHSGYQTIRATPVIAGDKAGGAVVIREDVSRWVEVENICKGENRRVRELLNASPDSALLVDPNGRFVVLNDEAARRRGLPPEELIGKNLYKNLDPEIAPFRRAMAEKVLASARPADFEERFGGRVYWVSIYPVQDEAGRVSHLASFSKDITERKQMENALARAKRTAEAAYASRTQLLANVSHELRNPLNGVLGAAQLASDQSLPEEQRELWNIVRESGEKLLRAVNTLLDLADISSHAMQPAMRPFDPRAVLGSVARSFELQARARGLDLRAEVSPEVPQTLYGDEFRLRTILASLLSNALRNTKSGLVLMSAAGVDDDELRQSGAITCAGGLTLLFTVEDTGDGIPPRRLPDVFDSLSAADDFSIRRPGLDAMELAVTRGLVELLGGRIWVESSTDSGSRFHFTAAFWSRAEEDSPSAVFRSACPEGPCILLAEDEDSLRDEAVAILTRLGCRVTATADGQEALHELRSGRFDAVLLDIQMPVMDGLTAARLIRSGELPGVDRCIPLLALVSYGTVRDRIQLLREGMSGIVSKPFSRQDIASVLDKVLRKIN